MQTEWNSATPNVVTSDIPREIEELLINIKYIAALPPGHKYNIGSQNYISATSFPSRVYRTVGNWIYTNEDKISTLNFINKTITTAIQLSRKHPKWQKLICCEVSQMTDTIANLEHVYSSEPGFVAQLSTLKLKVQPAAFNNACSNKESLNFPSIPTSVPSIQTSARSVPTPTPSVLASISASSAPYISTSAPPAPYISTPPIPIPAPSSTPPAIFFMEHPVPEPQEVPSIEKKTDSSTQAQAKGADRDDHRIGKKGGDRTSSDSSSA